MPNPIISNFNNILNNELKSPEYKKMAENEHNNNVNQSIEDFQKQNAGMMKMINFDYFNAQQQNQMIEISNVNFQLIFSIVPENGDQSLNNNIKICAQVRANFTIEKAIENFYKKLLKPKEAIKRFILNGNILDVKSQDTLASMNIDESTIIKAIKSENFDSLKLEGI